MWCFLSFLNLWFCFCIKVGKFLLFRICLLYLFLLFIVLLLYICYVFYLTDFGYSAFYPSFSLCISVWAVSIFTDSYLKPRLPAHQRPSFSFFALLSFVLCGFFICWFVCFAVLEIEYRAFILNYILPFHFITGSQLICPDWPWACYPSASVSQVAGITTIHHKACLFF